MSLRSMAVALALASLAGVSSQAQTPQSLESGNACFYSNQFESWRAPDDSTVLIRVGLSRYYRLDFAGRCGGITRASSHLINRVRGTTLICRPLDWDLAVADAAGFEQRCIVKSMTMLTPEEVASIPAKFRP